MEAPRENTPKRRLWLRILACVLAAMMLLSLFLLDAVRIKLRMDAKTDVTSAAADTLAEDSAYMEASTPERLSQWLQSALSRPDSFEDYYQIATILIAQGEYKRALTNIQESIRLYTAGDQAVIDELYMKQGGLHAMLGEYAAMEESFLHVSEDSGYHAQVLLLIAQAAIESGDTTKAIRYMEEYLKNDPDNLDMLVSLGQLYVMAEDYESAANTYGRAMESFEDASGTLPFLRGSCYLEIQEYALALEDFKAAFALGYADQSLCAAQCSLCSFLCGEYEACVTFGRRALEEPSAEVSESDLKHYMGLAAMTLGDYETAKEYFLSSAALDETRLDSAYYGTVCIMALGGIDEAIERFTALIDQGYGLELCRYNRAVCYIQKRQYAQAKADLEQVLKITEDEELAATATELLEQL